MSDEEKRPAEKILIADAQDVGAQDLLDALKAVSPAVLLISGSLLSAKRDDLLALRQLTAVMTDKPEEISRTNLDGVHIEPPRAIKADRTRFSSLNLGVGGLMGRHDAMRAGEEEADYVAFGSLSGAQDEDDFNTALEQAVWWADVMAVPCVIRVANAAQLQAAAEGGVDFIACRWQDSATLFQND